MDPYIASIRDIPFEDINTYLIDNGLPLSNDKNVSYALAKELIESGITDDVPESIADWITARKLKKMYDFSSYKVSLIITSTDDDLRELASLMGFNKVDKSRIIRILNYLHKLDNDLDLFAKLPDEILTVILEKLDLNTLKTICGMSTRLNKICNDNVIGSLIEEKEVYHKKRRNVSFYEEVHGGMDLSKLSSERSSPTNDIYTLDELKIYAKLLSLPTSGTKQDLVNRILYDRSELGL